MIVCVNILSSYTLADNKGEGGILSLMTLATHRMSDSSKRRAMIVLLGIFGASLLFGDGIITPAISVLSAIEGLKDGGLMGALPSDSAAALIWDHRRQMLIVGITIIILIAIFSVQFHGTQSIGKFFGPITFLWFLTLGGLGAVHLVNAPCIRRAFSPIAGTVPWHGVTSPF